MSETEAIVKVVEEPTSMINWQEELARQAQEAAEQEAGTGGKFFSIKGGQLAFDGMPIPGNRMAVIVLDSVISNTYYADKYDSENPSPPSCYAFGRDEKSMKPHENVSSPEASGCAECAFNKFGSAGKGKACQNRRRLALMAAGTLNEKAFTPFCAEEIPNQLVGFLALPPTSVNAYGTYVKNLAGALKVPPRAVFTKVEIVPHPKHQFEVSFTALGQVPADMLGAVMQRHKEVRDMIEFPYPDASEAPPAKEEAKPRKAKKY
jgi:hypothetical protein